MRYDILILYNIWPKHTIFDIDWLTLVHQCHGDRAAAAERPQRAGGGLWAGH